MATKDRTALKDEFKNGNLATGERFADLIDSMKVVQLPVVDPQALGTSLSFIDSISQDADGKITATKKTLDLANAHELNPFKGWYKTGDTLPTDGFDGAYLYFKDTTQTPAVTTIYQWNGTAYADTGTEVDESNVQTFASGQAVNAVKIKDENGEEASSAQGVLSAEAGVELNKQINGGVEKTEANGTDYWSEIDGRSEAITNGAIWVTTYSKKSNILDLRQFKENGYSKISIKANDSKSCLYTLVNSNFPSSGLEDNSVITSMLSAAMNNSNSIAINTGNIMEFSIDASDISYIIFYKNYSGDTTSRLPSVVTLIKENYISGIIVDRLDSNDSTRALSAKQGKVLKDGIDELKVDVEGIDDTEILADGTNIWQTVIGRGFSDPSKWDTSYNKTSKYIDLSTYKENGCNVIVVKGNSTKSGGYTLFNSSFNPSEITGNIEGSTYLNMLSTSMNGAGNIEIPINGDVEIDVTNNDIKYITFVDYDSRLPQSVKLAKRTVSTGLITRVEALEESIGNVPQLVIDTGRIISSLAENKRSDVRDKVRPLKILFIGNSFTFGVATDSFRNFTRLFTALGYEVVVGVSYYPSATVQYYDSIKNASTKVQYVKIKNTSSIITYESNYTNTTIEKVVDENWDVVFFIQGSASAGWYASYETYFSNLLNWLQTKVLSLGCRVGWFMPWAWTTDRIQNVPSGGDTYKGNDGQPTTNIDNATMFQQICVATQSNIQAHPEIAFFAPCGTAVENQYTNYPNSNVYLNDGQHLKNSPFSQTNDCTDAGKFAAQLALFGVLAKYFYNIELADIVYTANFSVVEEVFNQAKISALNAISTPYEVTVIS